MTQETESTVSEDTNAEPQETDGKEAGFGPDAIHQPAKVMRIATMVKQLLEEVKHAPLDEPSRARMADIYETSIRELGEVLSPELKDELARLSLPFNADTPSDAELRIAHAQLIGWLEGLFHGIQAMLFAQHAESQARLQEMQRPGLPEGQPPPPSQEPGQGTYL